MASPVTDKPPLPQTAALPAVAANPASTGAAANADADSDADGDDEKKLGDETDTPAVQIKVIPWKYKLTAFACLLLWGSGEWFAEQTFGPLKATIVRELKVTNAQFGAISSSASLVNTILPIIGGVGMDHFGASNAALVSSTCIVIGLIVSAACANTGHLGLLIGGRILAGFGSSVLQQTGWKLYGHWFAGSNIAFIYGLDIAWNRVLTVVSRACAVPMSKLGGWWGWALWIPVMVAAVCFCITVFYWFFERSVPLEYRPVTGAQKSELSWRKHFLSRSREMLRSLTTLPMFFWFVCITQVPQNGAAVAFQGNLADMQRVTRGTTELAAGYNTSLQGIMPIVLTPLVGLFIDRVGYRVWFFSWTAVLYVIVFALMGLTLVHPLVPILISSLAFCTNILPFIASVPVLVGDDSKLGSAFGVFNSFKQTNILVLDILAGAIQDRTPGKTYERVIYFLIAIKSVEVIWGPIYDWLDGKWLGHSLRMPEKKRVAFRQQVLAERRDLRGWRVEKPVLYAVAGIMACWITAGWVLYIVFALGT